MNSDNTQTAAVAMKCQGDVHIFNHPCTHCQCGRRIVTLPPGLDVTGPVTLSGPSALPDAPCAGGETQRWLDALDDAIATANAEAHDETQKARYRKAGRETSSALRELRSALPSLLARQRDGERLDWLEKCARDALNLAEGEYDDCRVIEAHHYSDMPEGEACFTAIGAQMRPDSRNGSYYTGEGMTIREAVDAVMSRVSAPSAERA